MNARNQNSLKMPRRAGAISGKVIRYLIFLVVSVGALAQTPTVTIIGTDGLSHSVVRLTYNVSAPFVNARTRYIASPGTCTGGSGGSVQQMSQAGYLTTGMRVVVGGLTPATHYQICPEVTADNTNWSSGAGVTVTTLPLPAIHPAPPFAPQTFSTAMPDVSGYTTVSVASDCHDFTSDLGTAESNLLTNGTVITLPATGCTQGGYYVPNAAPDTIAFAPSAVSVANSTITLPNHGFSEGQGIQFGLSYAALPASGSCIDGTGFAEQGFVVGEEFYAHVIDANTIQVYCNNPNGINASTGVLMTFTNQGSASGGNNAPQLYVRPWNNPALYWVIVRTATPDAQFAPAGTRVSPAWAPKLAQLTMPLSMIGMFAGSVLTVASNDPGNVEYPVTNIRFLGLEFTVADSPDSHTSSDPSPWTWLIRTYPQCQNIIFDRCFIHIPPPYARVTSGWYWDGSNMAVIDSYMDNLTYWHPNYTGLAATAPTSTSINVATGTYWLQPGNVKTLSTPVVINLSGTVTDNLFVYMDYSGVIQIGLPPGESATCSGGTCNVYNLASSQSIGSCNTTTAAFPHNSSGNLAAGPITCTILTNGQITGGAQTPTPLASQFVTEGSNFMIGGLGPGPYQVLDTYIEGAGLTWHHDEGGGDTRFRNDYTYNRDTFMVLMSHILGGASSDGLYYAIRHGLEWKSGGRIAITGTIFDGATVENTPIGDFFEFNSGNGGGTHDVLLQNNTLRHGPAGFFAPAVIPSSRPQGPPPIRFTVRNNLFWDISGNYHSPCCFGVSGGKGWIFANGGTGEEDTVFDHNTVIQNTGTLPSLWYITDTLHEGVQFTNNFLYLSAGDWGFETDHTPCPSGQGKATADCLFTNGYRFDHNVLMSNTTQGNVQAAWPSPLNYIPADPTDYFSAGFFNYDGAATPFVNGNPKNYNFRLNSNYCSGCGHPASDATDVGANIDVLEAAQGKVTLNGVPNGSITNNSATITFVAPDAQGCPVDYSSTDATVINSFTRVPDTGGNRSRNIALTGLSSGTVYYYRVNCAVEQPGGQFRTR